MAKPVPKACVVYNGQFPEPGTRLAYSIVLAEKTGRPTAENVIPEAEIQLSSPYLHDAAPEDPEPFVTGQFLKSHGKYGFIQRPLWHIGWP